MKMTKVRQFSKDYLLSYCPNCKPEILRRLAESVSIDCVIEGFPHPCNTYSAAHGNETVNFMFRVEGWLLTHNGIGTSWKFTNDTRRRIMKLTKNKQNNVIIMLK